MRHDLLCSNEGWCDDHDGLACQLLEAGRVDGIQMSIRLIEEEIR
jgi:hypothetical protein